MIISLIIERNRFAHRYNSYQSINQSSPTVEYRTAQDSIVNYNIVPLAIAAKQKYLSLQNFDLSS
jgi:hypothetical protein